MYSVGKGVQRNDAEAVRWHRKSAEQENKDGQFSLGWAYSSGRGVQRDYAEAVRWYRKSAELGDEVAAFNVGRIYEKGKPGVPRDRRLAMYWYNKAAEGYYPTKEEIERLRAAGVEPRAPTENDIGSSAGRQ